MTRTQSSARRPGRVLAVAGTALLTIASVGCTADRDAGGPEPTATTNTSTTTPATTTPATTTPAATVPVTTAPAAVSTLSSDETAGLLWMREEEQLAHDVYAALDAQWGLRIFENIAASETTHVAATIALLEQYGIADPAAGNVAGTFSDPQIQELYDRLILDGGESLEAALSVGALIEELDISDLQARSAATTHADIARVYSTLERGSRNHLRAFTSQLASRDIVYEPTRLDQQVYDAIVTGEMERGPGG